MISGYSDLTTSVLGHMYALISLGAKFSEYVLTLINLYFLFPGWGQGREWPRNLLKLAARVIRAHKTFKRMG